MVNDILDFAQLSQGRFRQYNCSFNLIQAFDDVLNIQKYKAEEFGINLKLEYENFEQLLGNQKKIQLQLDDDITVCTDKQRLQQILLNLTSNAFKFTSRGGEIKLKAKFVQNYEDLTFKDDEKLFEKLKKAQHGAIEIQVIDNGCGIK